VRRLGVAPLGLVEHAGDHGRRVGEDAGAHPLVLGDRSRGGLVAVRVSGWEDVGRGAGRWRRVVDGADLRHPLAVSPILARQSGLGLRARAGRAPRGPGAQRVGAHHDPLAVRREHQQLVGLAPGRAAGLVEALEVDRGERRELLDLALAEPLPGVAFDRLARGLEAASGALHRSQLAQPVRVALDRQIQRRVGGMQVPHPGRPIRQPLHAHGPEHRLKRALVACLDPTAGHTLVADHLLKALLVHCPQRQMIIKQPAQQLPSVAIKTLLKLRVREPGGVRPIQKAKQRLELLAA